MAVDWALRIAGLLVGVALLLIAARGLLRRGQLVAEFVARWGIDEKALFVRTDIPQGSPVEVYEGRTHRSVVYGNGQENNFAMPLEIDEYRCVSTRPGVGFQRAVGEWHSNDYETQENGQLTRRPMMQLRPLTDEELHTVWPQVAALSAKCDREAYRLIA